MCLQVFGVLSCIGTCADKECMSATRYQQVWKLRRACQGCSIGRALQHLSMQRYIGVRSHDGWSAQTLDERLNAAMSTLADAEQRLSLAEQSGAQHRQQHNAAQARCVHHCVYSLASLGAVEKASQPCRFYGHVQRNVSLQLRLNVR